MCGISQRHRRQGGGRRGLRRGGGLRRVSGGEEGRKGNKEMIGDRKGEQGREISKG